jgi:hypothetical protein
MIFGNYNDSDQATDAVLALFIDDGAGAAGRPRRANLMNNLFTKTGIASCQTRDG